MKPSGILVLLPFTPKDILENVTKTNKPTRESIKAFQEGIQYQSMSITTCDQNLVLLGMVLIASDYDPINNKNSFSPPTDPVPAPVNAIVTATQITNSLRIYKDN